MTSTPKSWRDVLPIHPAADLFPLMTPDELKALGEDIKKNGLRSPIVLWATGDQNNHGDYQLLDGQNRLDAMEMVGLKTFTERGKNPHTLADHSHVTGTGGGPVVLHLREFVEYSELSNLERKRRRPDVDPYAYVISANAYRRHLTAEQKRDLIAKLLKLDPGKSNRTIGKQAKASHHTVGEVRSKLEATGQTAQLKKTTGADGKARTTKPKKRRTADDFTADITVQWGIASSSVDVARAILPKLEGQQHASFREVLIQFIEAEA